MTTTEKKKKSKAAPRAKVLQFVPPPPSGSEGPGGIKTLLEALDAVKLVLVSKKPADVAAAREKVKAAYVAEMEHLFRWSDVNSDDRDQMAVSGRELTVNEHNRACLRRAERQLEDTFGEDGPPKGPVVFAEVVNLATVRRAVARSKRRGGKERA